MDSLLFTFVGIFLRLSLTNIPQKLGLIFLGIWEGLCLSHLVHTNLGSPYPYLSFSLRLLFDVIVGESLVPALLILLWSMLTVLVIAATSSQHGHDTVHEKQQIRRSRSLSRREHSHSHRVKSEERRGTPIVLLSSSDSESLQPLPPSSVSRREPVSETSQESPLILTLPTPPPTLTDDLEGRYESTPLVHSLQLIPEEMPTSPPTIGLGLYSVPVEPFHDVSTVAPSLNFTQNEQLQQPLPKPPLLTSRGSSPEPRRIHTPDLQPPMNCPPTPEVTTLLHATIPPPVRSASPEPLRLLLHIPIPPLRSATPEASLLLAPTPAPPPRSPSPEPPRLLLHTPVPQRPPSPEPPRLLLHMPINQRPLYRSPSPEPPRVLLHLPIVEVSASQPPTFPPSPTRRDNELDELQTPQTRTASVGGDSDENDELRTPKHLSQALQPDTPPVSDAVAAAQTMIEEVGTLLTSTQTILPATDGLSTGRNSPAESVILEVGALNVKKSADDHRQEAWALRDRLVDLKARLTKAERENRPREAFMLKGDLEECRLEMERLHKKAARRYIHAGKLAFNEETKRHPLQTLDVHGLFVEEAIQSTEKKLRELIKIGESSLRVIVGRGNHSKNGPKLRPALITHMTQQNIKATVDSQNPGVLILTCPPR